MADNEGFALGSFPDFFGKLQEDRRIQEEEQRIRYAHRRQKKVETRNVIEHTAVQICRTAEKIMEAGGESVTPEAMAQLATAVNQAAAALQAAEMYAEYMPMTGGFCAV